MQAIGHQVVGGKNRSHGDVKMMYEVFFGRKAVHVKGKLKGQLGSVETKQILSHIFQVYMLFIYDHSNIAIFKGTCAKGI